MEKLVEAGGGAHVTTVDVWDTLLRRRCHPDEVKLASAKYVLLTFWSQLHPDYRTQRAIFERRVAAEVEIGSRRKGLGLDHHEQLFVLGIDEHDAAWRIIVDPIDGTRGLMYQKRSAWILTGVAPNRGSSTSLRDIVLAVQTEIPLVKQHLADQVARRLFARWG